MLLWAGEIGDAFAQSSIPTQSKTIGSKGKARNRVKMSEFLLEQELQQSQMGRRKTRDELADGLRISVYEKKLNTCACKHFWSWHPDSQLSDYWNSLASTTRQVSASTPPPARSPRRCTSGRAAAPELTARRSGGRRSPRW